MNTFLFKAERIAWNLSFFHENQFKVFTSNSFSLFLTFMQVEYFFLLIWNNFISPKTNVIKMQVNCVLHLLNKKATTEKSSESFSSRDQNAFQNMTSLTIVG